MKEAEIEFLPVLKDVNIVLSAPLPIKQWELSENGIFHFYTSKNSTRKVLFSIPRENMLYIKTVVNA